jgi:hypothetical protein
VRLPHWTDKLKNAPWGQTNEDQAKSKQAEIAAELRDLLRSKQGTQAKQTVGTTQKATRNAVNHAGQADRGVSEWKGEVDPLLVQAWCHHPEA